MSGSACGERRKWGSSTQLVVEAIQNTCSTLREIANYTGIPYRSVNAFIASLEKQERVRAEDYAVKRQHQRFVLITEEERASDPLREYTRSGSNQTLADRGAITIRAAHRTMSNAVLQLQSTFGMALPTSHRTYQTRVHRGI